MLIDCWHSTNRINLHNLIATATYLFINPVTQWIQRTDSSTWMIPRIRIEYQLIYCHYCLVVHDNGFQKKYYVRRRRQTESLQMKLMQTSHAQLQPSIQNKRVNWNEWNEYKRLKYVNWRRKGKMIFTNDSNHEEKFNE